MTAWPNATQDWLNVSNGEYVLPACLIPSQLVEYKLDQFCYLFMELCFMKLNKLMRGWGRPIMLFNLFIWIEEYPARADKSAVGAINRPPPPSRKIFLKSKLAPTDGPRSSNIEGIF